MRYAQVFASIAFTGFDHGLPFFAKQLIHASIRTSRVPVRAGSRGTVMYLQAAADTMVFALGLQ